jgi:hypothetical protein
VLATGKKEGDRHTDPSVCRKNIVGCGGELE